MLNGTLMLPRLAILLLLSTLTAAQQLTIAAAADLSSVLPELAAQYKKQAGIDLKLTFGSSGNLTTQIENGAPFDIFFSADEGYPKQLIDKGLVEKDSLYRYAVGSLVLWVPSSVHLNPDALGIATLTATAVKKIAIANPQHAPYGRAAEAAIRHFGIYDQISPKLVLGENVSQAAQFLESGNAQAGLIPLSHALSPGMNGKGQYWVLPADTYPPLNQAVVILTRSKQKEAARKFLDFLRTPEATSLLRRYGFTLP
jgi:molybdate transport system substrate-binding protein